MFGAKFSLAGASKGALGASGSFDYLYCFLIYSWHNRVVLLCYIDLQSLSRGRRRCC